jgi:hypothetical protein
MADMTERDEAVGLRAQVLLSSYRGSLTATEVLNLERIVADPSEADRSYLGLFDRLLDEPDVGDIS